MCGIYLYLSKLQKTVYKNFKLLKHRGPDLSSTIEFNNNNYQVFLGFHRLSIVGIHDGNQPFQFKDEIYCLVNGEIYNYKQLIEKYDLPVKSKSDCEVVIHLYKKFGIDVINLLDGVFSIIIYDAKHKNIYFTRDPIGVRPLFYHINNDDLILSSEMKTHPGVLKQVKPGIIYNMDLKSHLIIQHRYYEIPEKTINTDIKEILKEAVIKRLPEETDVGFLLSGGLDSSLILSIAIEYYNIYNSKKLPIKCFSIGFDEKSPDIIGAKKVVEFLNKKYPDSIIHDIVIKKTTDGIEAIPNVIEALESYDTTTIRASTPMYLLLEHIKTYYKNIKVILSGEGADELFGGYLYFHYAPNKKEFDDERKRLTNELYYYDVLRADRMTSIHSLELRVPFLDFKVIEYAMCNDVYFPDKKEKYILRNTFEGYLPDEILWGQKEAFSDGCGYNWLDDLREYARKIYDNDSKYPEETMFKQIFNIMYPNRIDKDIIPHIWLPKWIDTGESSARFLDLHQTNKKIEIIKKS